MAASWIGWMDFGLQLCLRRLIGIARGGFAEPRGGLLDMVSE